MHINEILEISNKYNIESYIILHKLEEILHNKMNMQQVFLKKDGKGEYRFYERFFDETGRLKERKIRLTKKNIERVMNILQDELIKESNKRISESILRKYPNRVVKGKVVNITNLAVEIIFDNRTSYLYHNKKKKDYKIGEEGYFHINKIKIKKGIPLVILDDKSIEITKQIIYDLVSGIYIEKIREFKDAILLKTIPKLSKDQKEILELNLGKKIILRK